jgi:thioesterase domain-containing protein
MLVPVQPSGKNPPLFIVHGILGIMPLGRCFVQGLGPDQAFYAVNANGFYAGQAVAETTHDMVQTYTTEIVSSRPSGPLIVGGMCAGGLLAIEIARELQAKGRKVAPLILVDPPILPVGVSERTQRIDPRPTEISWQLYAQTRRQLLDHASHPYNDMPFDPNDPMKMHLATLAGVSSLVALSKHVPAPFSGDVELILSAKRAPKFFHPQSEWRTILPGAQTVHVLPGGHDDMLRAGREQTARVLKFVLEGIARSLASAEHQLDYAGKA